MSHLFITMAYAINQIHGSLLEVGEKTLWPMSGTSGIPYVTLRYRLAGFLALRFGYRPGQVQLDGDQGKLAWEMLKSKLRDNKKQAVISAAYSHKKNEAWYKRAHKAGVLSTDENFEYCIIDRYCQEAIYKKLQLKDKKIHAYLVDWANVQFGRKGDDVPSVKALVKFGGLKYLDAERGYDGDLP